MITPAFDYGNPITQGGGGEPAPSTAWTRPSDWLAMPTVTTAEQKVVGLHAVWPSDGNFVAVTCAGNYQVDWGDGNTTTHSSGAAAYHEYDYSTISASTDSTRGYRQVLVTITPQAGANLTSVNFYTKHNQSGLVSGYSTGWLELLISLPQCTTTGLTIGSTGTNVRHHMLERVAIIEQGSLNTYQNLFYNCQILQDVQLDDSAAVTNMSSMFYGCFSIKSVPLFDTSSATTMFNMFSLCYSLQTIPLFVTSSVTTMAGMFSSCNSLESVPLFNMSSVTNINNMFFQNFKLQSIPLFDTSAVTNMGSTFFSCVNLVSVPLLNTSSVTTMSSMFNSCRALSSLPALDASAVTSSGNYSDMFSGCSSLSSIAMTGHKYTFSVASCKLSASDLDTLYTNLATVVGQTITVSGNYGTAGDDPTIATGKGWTVSG